MEKSSEITPTSHLEVDHVPEPLEVHDGGLLLACAVGAALDQPGELLEAALLVHQEARLTDRRPDLPSHLLVRGRRRGQFGLPPEETWITISAPCANQ